MDTHNAVLDTMETVKNNPRLSFEYWILSGTVLFMQSK